MTIKINHGLIGPTLALMIVMCAVTQFAHAQAKESKSQEEKNKEIVGKWLNNF